MKFFQKKEKTLPPTEALGKLRTNVAMLEKREAFLQAKSDAEQDRAKECLAKKNKKGALAYLKRKKVFDAQIEKCQNTRLTIEQQMMALENSNIMTQTVKGMQAADLSMKQMQKEVGGIDKVEDTLDNIRENMDEQDQISNALAGGLGNDVIDEDDLANELAELEAQELDDKMMGLKTGSSPVAASKASTSVVAGRTKKNQMSEDEELKALEASMAL